MRTTVQSVGSILAAASLLAAAAIEGCSRRASERATPQTLEEAFARAGRCAPANNPLANVSLAIKAVEIEPQAMKLRIEAAAKEGPVDFDLPVYRLSGGRWLISETGRAYVLDDKCREYRLKDRKAIPGYEIPLEGRVKLSPGMKFEAILVFPRAPESARAGMLVYSGQTLPFLFGPESGRVK